MPRISTFYGIVIVMNYREHGVPHVHALYGGSRASVDIRTRRVLAGSLPERALRLVEEWAALHEEELLTNWQRAVARQPVVPVAPLP